MHWIDYVAYFFGGAFLANALPHLLAGLLGRAFQSPFAKPPGKGLSSSRTNVLWGFANLAAGYGLIFHVGAFDARSPDIAAAALGALLLSLRLADHMGALHGGNTPALTADSAKI